ncbi:MAG: dihydrodipicolinate synthase family protein [Clostridia bacterium]|nr:dihydrodipicolinate synthase family protein [Clostridia bacterium]
MFENKYRFTGIIPPIISPMDKDRRLDCDALRRLIDFNLDGGASGIFCMGSAGEAMMVSREDWLKCIKVTVEHVAGRAPVFAGVIDSSTARVIENIKQAEQAGAVNMVVTPAFYLQNTCQDEIIRHYEIIAHSTKSSIVAYNIPPMVHCNIDPETAVRIAEIDNVVAYKDSSGDWERFQRLLFLLGDRDISVLCGLEEMAAAAVLMGAQGCVPGMSNCFPKLYSSLYRACVDRDIDLAFRLQKDCYMLRKAVGAGSSWVSAIKYIASVMGFGENIASYPIQPLTEQQMRRIDEIVAPYLST